MMTKAGLGVMEEWYSCPKCGESLRYSDRSWDHDCPKCECSLEGHQPNSKRCTCNTCKRLRLTERQKKSLLKGLQEDEPS